MATTTFLAMTAAEIGKCTTLPPVIAWMACHFSPYGTGLSNLPKTLPAGSLLILNDRTPIHRHDPKWIGKQLTDCVERFQCAGLLLDFQNPGCVETTELTKHLVKTLSCPVAVSAPYADDLTCPVFLPPLPHHMTLEEYIAPWQSREIWLELALDREIITLTESGADIAALPSGEVLSDGHWDEALHCHYHIDVSEEAARFTLWRTREDLNGLLAEAEDLGVTTAVGLYQELGFCAEKPTA